jgi:hypothetical protein
MNESIENLEQPAEKPSKPDEKGGFYFSSSIKIFDPNTEEVLVQQRGDN